MTNQEQWIRSFEEATGRKPSPLEFKEGKEKGFLQSDIPQIAGIAETLSDTPDQKYFEDRVSGSTLDDPNIDDFESQDQGTSATATNAQEEAIFYDVSDDSYFEVGADHTEEVAVPESRPEASEELLYDVADEGYQEAKPEVHMPVAAPKTPDVKSNAPTSAPKVNSRQAEWLQAFEHYVGRKPSPEEFKLGKSSDFDLRVINQFLANRAKVAKKPLTPMKKYAYIAGGIAAFLLVVGFLFGNHYYSRESVAKRYLKQYSSKVAERLDYEVWSDSTNPIKKSEISYLESTDQKAPELVALTTGSSMKEVGRKWLLFPDWKVAVTPADTTVTTNTEDMDVMINGKIWVRSDSDQFSKAIRLYPGTYQFTLSGKVGDQSVEASSKQALSGKQEVSLDINYLSFTVNSNVSDGDLYVGSKKIATLKDGMVDVSNLAVTKNAKIFVQKTFEDSSQLKSETYAIKDLQDGDTITLDAKGLLDRDTADYLVTAAYNKLDLYEDSHTTPDGLTEIFQGGTDNSMYQDVVNMIETNTTNAKNRPAESISFEDIDVTNVKQVGAKNYVIEFTVVNSFYYAYDSKFRNSGFYDDKTAWSVNAEYVGQSKDSDYSFNDYTDYRITGKASDSKLINREDTVN
ncbi:zinc ribbon domain-containing protein [Streptococcus hyovaginalis]|uniref:zinc ribbon domain-containing protein n=1 Tax=Streptococcus hyovaginalis TaxID=149015 RepID=UPI002A82C73D|nr:hypothetical protein [Streptococcus hyovaginalis]MDY4511520.1 hypothetical protein [Streptococcus hyovaginalis]